MRSFKENAHAMVDLSVVLMVGIAFVALMVVAYLIYELQEGFGLLDAPTVASSGAYNTSYYAENSTRGAFANITGGFDDAVALILVAITIFILAIAISALLILRGRQ